jgi:hypothetical protein
MTADDALKNHFDDQFAENGDEPQPMEFMTWSCGGTVVQD